jgi:hypothetical protein
MKKTLILFSISLVFCLFANAQSLNLELKSGTINKYPLSEIRKQTFSSTEMILTKTDGTVLTFNLIDIRKFTFGLTTEVVKVEKPQNEALVFPNPSTGLINIDFNLAEKSMVDISIFSIDGKMIQTILSEEKTQGNHTINWQNNNLPEGTYFVKIQTNNNIESKKIIILK